MQKINSGKPLSTSDIEILDNLISQISHQATVAFLKMRKVSFAKIENRDEPKAGT